MTAADRARARLAWRCRRGMRELDRLLSAHLEAIGADAAALDLFARLLEAEDDVLWDWLSGRARPEDPELDSTVASVRASRERA